MSMGQNGVPSAIARPNTFLFYLMLLHEQDKTTQPDKKQNIEQTL
jgi:hypothetical protein